MEHETLIRFGVFLGLFAVLATAESLAPRRIRKQSRSRRWIANWGMTLLNTAVLRLLAFAIPLLAVGAAIDASNQDGASST